MSKEEFFLTIYLSTGAIYFAVFGRIFFIRRRYSDKSGEFSIRQILLRAITASASERVGSSIQYFFEFLFDENQLMLYIRKKNNPWYNGFSLLLMILLICGVINIAMTVFSFIEGSELYGGNIFTAYLIILGVSCAVMALEYKFWSDLEFMQRMYFHKETKDIFLKE